MLEIATIISGETVDYVTARRFAVTTLLSDKLQSGILNGGGGGGGGVPIKWNSPLLVFSIASHLMFFNDVHAIKMLKANGSRASTGFYHSQWAN